MTLRRGDKGSGVVKLQQDLIELGYGHLMEPMGRMEALALLLNRL